MNVIRLISVAILITFIVIFSKWDKVYNDHNTTSDFDLCVTGARSSVTFIMGTDEPNANSFYKNASYYFHMHPTDKTDFVIHSCKTLKDILDYLTNQPENKYFGTVNIVCHGNPWQGLSMPIATRLPRASLPNLQSALKNKWITPLCTNSVDHHTQINIISCGIGQNTEISEILKEIFSCPNSASVPRINIETYYVNFTDKLDKKRSEFYFVASKYNYSDAAIITGKLINKYKKTSINWQKAYRNEDRNSGNVPYKHHFRMLVDWKIGFIDSTEIPELKKDADILKWLKTQKTAMKELQQMQLKPEDFMWHCFTVTDQPNTIKIKGYSNVEGVMVDLPADIISPNMAILY